MPYLFTHFTGEHKDGEQLYFSISKDGLFWTDLNEGKPVMKSGIGEKGIRDPYIVRNKKTGKYYIIATDLRIEADKGWWAAQFAGSRDMIIWESDDLVNWSKERAVTLAPEKATCLWAPEAVYDEEKGAFFVFFASMIKEEKDEEPKQKIYGTYTEDFVSFTPAEKYIEREKHTIDTTIIYTGGYYYRFSKCEVTKRIIAEKGKKLDGEFTAVDSPVLENLEGVEGPECYILPDGSLCLVADRFAKGLGYLPLVTKDIEKEDFHVLDDAEFDFDKAKKRHGGIIEISDEEYLRLKSAYGKQNPVLDGLYADPDIAFFDGKYYIYPTSDGFNGWSGTKFSVFSSEDGVNFKDEGVIVDVASKQVPWAVGSAWAPCIAHKKGKYYFYFCAKEKNGVSAIGVAVSDSPTGPFKAENEPLITMDMMRRNNIRMGQTIDPSIYYEGDEVYILFGNCEAAMAKLGEDMISLDESSLKNIEGLKDFREAVTVFKKDGKYHFTWSCDDTSSENYHVNYGIAESLFGKVKFIGTILEKDPARNILGTGHHSIMKMPGEDKYIIAYHRFGTPLKKYPEGKGFNRETCLGEIEFDEKGYIRKIEMID